MSAAQPRKLRQCSTKSLPQFGQQLAFLGRLERDDRGCNFAHEIHSIQRVQVPSHHLMLPFKSRDRKRETTAPKIRWRWSRKGGSWRVSLAWGLFVRTSGLRIADQQVIDSWGLVMEQPLVLSHLILSTMPLPSYQTNYPTLQFGCVMEQPLSPLSYLFDLINHASLILLNKLSILFHPIIVWPCGQYYKVQGWAHV